MQWLDYVKNAIEWASSQTIPVIGLSVLSAAILLFSFLAKTSIGKKSLLELKKLFESLKHGFAQLLIDFSNFKDCVNTKLDEENEKLKLELEKRDEQIKNMEKLILDICENIHNKKVKEIVAEYKKDETSEVNSDE